MGARFCLALVAFGQLCAVAVAQEQPVGVTSPSSAGSATYITHVTVIDTKFGKEVQDRTVIILGDRISEVTEKNTDSRIMSITGERTWSLGTAGTLSGEA